MLYSLSRGSNMYSTANGAVFRAVMNYVENEDLNPQEVAEALNFLQHEEKRQALLKRIEREYPGQTPEQQLRLTQILRKGDAKLPVSGIFKEVTPEILALMLKVGYDRPLNLATLKGFQRPY
jgi:hypothetical protein